MLKTVLLVPGISGWLCVLVAGGITLINAYLEKA